MRCGRPVAVVAGDVEPRRLPARCALATPSSSARARRRSPSGTRRPSPPTPPSRSSARPEPHGKKSVDPRGPGSENRTESARARPGCSRRHRRTQETHTHMPQLIDTGSARRTAASPDDPLLPRGSPAGTRRAAPGTSPSTSGPRRSPFPRPSTTSSRPSTTRAPSGSASPSRARVTARGTTCSTARCSSTSPG